MKPAITLGLEQSAANARKPSESPWGIQTRIAIVLWELCWTLLCEWTPKPFNRWRLLMLRLFGARIHGLPFVHQRARIQMPWNLTLNNGSCLGDRANAYSLGSIEIGAHAVVAQEAYLCTGSHAFDHPGLPLLTSKISVGKGAFIGARAFILPGVSIGDGAIVGACSVVTSDVMPFTVNAGNPCRLLKPRERSTETHLPQASGCDPL